MEILTSTADIVALRFTGRLSPEEVRKAFELIEQALALHERIHLFVEVDELAGIEWEAMTQELTRGLRLFGKLKRFGRVAIVSDQSWLRWLARTESALLPGISYRTYRIAERDRARAWVEGREELPYGHAMRVIGTNRPDVLGIEIDGRLSKEEMASISVELNAARSAQEIKSVLLRIRSFEGFDPSIALDGDYARMKLGFFRELDRYAVVGGPQWIRQWVEFLGPLVRMEVRYFPPENESAAWEWLGAKPLADPAPADRGA